MRTYMMEDKIKDINDTVDKCNEEMSKFASEKGRVFIHLPELTMGTLDILGAQPGINAVRNQKKFTEDTDWDNMKVTKRRSCLKKVRKLVRSSWK